MDRAKRWYAINALLCVILTSGGMWKSSVASDTRRRFEVRDSIEMAYFGTPILSAPDDQDDDAVVSPDGRHFVKLTHRGVLPGGVTEGTVWLFDTALTKRTIADPKLSPPPPIPLARMSAAVNSGLQLYVLDAGNTITQPQWSEDGKRLTFLGRNGSANRQLFSVDLATHVVKALTPASQDVLVYAMAGDAFAYLAGPDADLQAEQAWVSAGPGIPDITVGTATPLMPLLYPHFKGNAYGEPVELELWQVRGDRATPVADARSGSPVTIKTRYSSLLLSLSPDTTGVVTISEERGPAVHGNPIKAAEPAMSTLEYRLIDLRSGGSTALVSSPIASQGSGRYRAAWAPDGTEVAITRLMSVPESGDSTKTQTCDVALVRIGTPNARCIATLNPKQGAFFDIVWLNAGEINVRYKIHRESTYLDTLLRRQGSAWVAETPARQGVVSIVELSIRESLNEPPVLVATDPRTGKSRVIFDPNPQLAGIAMGSVSIYRWKDAHGREDSGGLVLPPDFTRNKRYPLVIQTHGFNPRQFFRSGYSDTSNAGRATAGRDMLVLQVQEPHSAGEGNWRDGVELGMDVYLAAIDKLAAEGIVDPKRIGISGYSYSGWLVATSLARAPDRFAAAEIANSDPVTLTGYYEYVGTPLAKADADFYVGARPYGEGLKDWIDRVPSLSTDKITAAVLFQPADPWHLLGIWDMYAAMLDQGKPVELQYMRSGEHNIRKPLQVLAHQEMIVDWFDFWLNAHEDQIPEKAEQYARWRKLREARLAQAPVAVPRPARPGSL